MTGRPVRRDVVLTGEITLRGRILPIGGVKEKALATHRAGIRTFVLPKKNQPDLEDVPKNILRHLHVVLVDHMEEVLPLTLREAPPACAKAVPPEGLEKIAAESADDAEGSAPSAKNTLRSRRPRR
jgi:ATP-dependent Lon protease